MVPNPLASANTVVGAKDTCAAADQPTKASAKDKSIIFIVDKQKSTDGLNCSIGTFELVLIVNSAQSDSPCICASNSTGSIYLTSDIKFNGRG